MKTFFPVMLIGLLFLRPIASTLIVTTVEEIDDFSTQKVEDYSYQPTSVERGLRI
jgi:hypothetical protein